MGGADTARRKVRHSQTRYRIKYACRRNVHIHKHAHTHASATHSRTHAHTHASATHTRTNTHAHYHKNTTTHTKSHSHTSGLGGGLAGAVPKHTWAAAPVPFPPVPLKHN